MAIESVDLWGHVQRQVFAGGEGASPPRGMSNVRLLPSSEIVHLCIEDDHWHGERYHDRGDHIFAALQSAVSHGQDRKASRLRAAWVHQVQLDRIAWARDTARERGLRFDPIGRGPIVDEPTVHMRDRLPWSLIPVDRYGDRRLPDRAVAVLDRWNGTGNVFDGLYVADEPVSSGHFLVHSLVGAISPDRRSGDWFVLDRWAS